MDAKTIIESALTNGNPALSEYRSKQVLQAYDISVPRETLTTSAKDAATAAESIGYPVVLKACSPTLMHKSESGLVALNVKNSTEVQQVYEDLSNRAEGRLEGILVQEMITGKRELLVGLIRDSQFGPCVMLGLGGIMAEVLKDTAFRMAPLDAWEAADMCEQLRAKKLLKSFRGEAPVDKDALYQCLIQVGQIGLDFPALAEIDINPLIITASGRVVAVDALIVLK